ncbi:MAG TPA: PmoA family protein [Armatimonadota bacterium]|nr:PmoA family protein [Armatimonadota bacterium]
MTVTRRDVLAGACLAALGARRAAAAPAFTLSIEEEDLYARRGQAPVLRYRRRTVPAPAGATPLLASSGYLHPVWAPCGAVVTNHLSPDHLHQRGVFSAWTKTRVVLDGEELHPDFWNIHEGTGRVRSTGVQTLRGGAGFRATHVSEARRGQEWVPVLDERWEVRFPARPVEEPGAPRAAHVFDLTSRQTPRHAIELLKYHYGGMAVRGSGQWAKGSDMQVLTSEGKGRVEADQHPARWVDMSGTVDGKPAGIALLEHPTNLHAPNGVRMHPDMPYYVFALPQSGPVTLEAGKEYVFRYRLVAHNGRADRELLDALWAEFAKQP